MNLFEGVYYHLSSSFSFTRSSELSHILDINGAIAAKSIDDRPVTHFITSSNKFERWQDVAALEEAGEISVVTDKWVDRSVVLGKMQLTAFYSADPAMIFSGVVACATELPTTDLEVLSAGITALGGQWRVGLTKDVTHLFATSPSGPKYTTALHFQEQTRIKVLLPHWFDDAVRLGIASLDTSPYEWPEPTMLKGPDAEVGEGGNKDKEKEEAIKKATRKLDAEKRTLYKTASLWAPDDPLPVPPEPPSSTTSTPSPVDSSAKNVWQGRRVLLSSTLELVGGRREAVEVGIVRAGGEVAQWDAEELEGGEKRKAREAEMVEQCDVFVTRFRSGKAYASAVRHAKTIGTLPWMYHVQSTGVFSPPMDQLLWYPIPKKPIEGFSGHEITVTNYTGESREYLKKLIMAMGATFTPSMSGRNTVLIAAFISGTKTTKAASWSIPIVNHTWLEDCFVKWRNLTMALEKYIVFPPGVDFAKMLGERGVGRLVEEMVEEELQVLEEEDEGEGEGMKQGGTVVNGLEREEKEDMIFPIGTENSARDAREVEDEVALGVDGDVDMVHGDDHGDEHVHEDAMNVDDARAPDKKRKRGIEKADETEQAQADDEDEDDDAVVMPPRKKAPLPPSQTSTQRKSLTSRLQEKVEESAAKTRVKKSKPKEKEEEEGSDSAQPEVVRVTKRRSGRLDVQVESPRSRRSQRKGRLESEIETSSEDDEIEIVEVRTPAGMGKGKMEVRKKLVRRAGGRHDSWIEEGVEELGRKMKKTPRKKNDDSDEEEEDVLVNKTKKPPIQKVSSDEEAVVRMAPSSEEEEEEEEVVLPKAKPKAKKTPSKKVDSDEEMREAEEEEPVKSKRGGRGTARVSTSAAPKKGRAKGKTLPVNYDDGESEVEPVTYSKAKAKGKEVEKPKERPKPRPVSKVTAKAKVAEQTTEPEDEDEDELPSPKKSTVTDGKATSTITSSAKKGKQNESAASPTKTPKRVVSVLMPPLKLTPKISPQQAGTPHTNLTRMESIRVAAGEHPRASMGRPSAAAAGTASKTKSKSKVAEVESSPALSVTEDGVSVSGRSKRNAATKATQKLHDEIMPDVMNYQQEKRKEGKGRKSFGGAGGVRANGGGRQKRLSDGGEEEGGDKKRRRTSAVSAKGKTPASEEEEGEDEVTMVAKTSGKAKGKSIVRLDPAESEESEVQTSKKGDAKMKKGKEKAVEVDQSPRNAGAVRLITTQVTLSEDVIKALTKLGVKMTTRAAECTHILAPALVRTEKFLCALAVAPFILTEAWATESAAAKRLLDEDDYTLYDKAGERKYGFVLDEAVERARKLKGKLFAGTTFYVTPRVAVDIKLLKNVVTACGGQISTQMPTLRVLNSSPDRHVVSCLEDISIWRPIAKKYPIYTHELILTSALKQEIEWENEEFRVPSSSDILE